MPPNSFFIHCMLSVALKLCLLSQSESTEGRGKGGHFQFAEVAGLIELSTMYNHVQSCTSTAHAYPLLDLLESGPGTVHRHFYHLSVSRRRSTECTSTHTKYTGSSTSSTV